VIELGWDLNIRAEPRLLNANWFCPLIPMRDWLLGHHAGQVRPARAWDDVTTERLANAGIGDIEHFDHLFDRRWWSVQDSLMVVTGVAAVHRASADQLEPARRDSASSATGGSGSPGYRPGPGGSASISPGTGSGRGRSGFRRGSGSGPGMLLPTSAPPALSRPTVLPPPSPERVQPAATREVTPGADVWEAARALVAGAQQLKPSLTPSGAAAVASDLTLDTGSCGGELEASGDVASDMVPDASGSQDLVPGHVPAIRDSIETEPSGDALVTDRSDDRLGADPEDPLPIRERSSSPENQSLKK